MFWLFGTLTTESPVWYVKELTKRELHNIYIIPWIPYFPFGITKIVNRYRISKYFRTFFHWIFLYLPTIL